MRNNNFSTLNVIRNSSYQLKLLEAIITDYIITIKCNNGVLVFRYNERQSFAQSQTHVS